MTVTEITLSNNLVYAIEMHYTVLTELIKMSNAAVITSLESV
jgi:hypothetical protein